MQSKHPSFDRASIASRSISHRPDSLISPNKQQSRMRSPEKPVTSSKTFDQNVSQEATLRSSTMGPKGGVPGIRALPKSKRIPGAKSLDVSHGRSSTRPAEKPQNTPQKAQSKRPGGQAAHRQSNMNMAQDASVAGDSASPKSSATLRQTIARAKAAHRAVSGSAKPAHASTADNFPVVELGGDSKSMSKRVATAREKGQLNIPNMGLKRLPNEILSMYDASFFDSMDGSWAESVDLLKINAADNEIDHIDEKFFPRDSGEEGSGGSFVLATVETLDLHGNQLVDLPQSFDTLERLVTLNLSRNILNDGSLRVVCRLHWLRELRLADNNLKNIDNSDFVALTNLEIFDLSNNGLSAIPGAIITMTKLHTLILSGNKLSSLPEDIFRRLRLRDLLVARNSLKGTLLPPSPVETESMRTIDVSYNALTCFSTDPEIEMPKLQTLNISQNRLKTMPSLAALHNLITFTADGNQLTETPAGLQGLAFLKNVDLSRNDIRHLDPHIGLMHGLSVFSIANNPIRERRLLSMNTEDLKRELRSKLDSAETAAHLDGDDKLAAGIIEDEKAVQCVIQPGGIVDKSSSGQEDLDSAWFENVAKTEAVKSLILTQNSFDVFPSAIQYVGKTLTSLDLSRNKLSRTGYLSSTLCLPQLKNLSLAANSIATLSPLLSYLSAEALNELDISRNRLTALPRLRSAFPKLSIVKAADNSISDLPFESVQGLQVLDVGGNEISSLEPRIGLLGQEGLRVFLVGANTFRVPRRDVVEKGTGAILNWLRNRIPDE